MVVRLGVARVDEGHLIDVFAEVWEDAGDHFSALAAGGEFEWGFHDPADGVGEKSGELVEALEFFAVVFGEGGLVVKGIDLAGAAVDEDPNDAFGFGREVGAFRGERVGSAEEVLFAEERREAEETGAAAGVTEDVSAR